MKKSGILAMNGRERIKDVSPLAEIPTLTSLLIPKGVKGIEALRKLPKLEYLGTEYSGDVSQPAPPAAEFWAEWDKNHKPPQ